MCGKERDFANSTELQGYWTPQAQRYPVAPQPKEEDEEEDDDDD